MRRVWILVAILAALGSLTGPASASFPGRNGTIVYGWLGDAAYRAGPVATSIRAVDPLSGLVRVLRDCPLQQGGGPTYADCIVGAPRVSPDGTRVAFANTRVIVRLPDPGEFRPGIGLMAADGTGLEEHLGENS